MSTVAVLLLVGIWLAWLRPPSLGGRTSVIIVAGRSMLPTYDPGDLVLLRRQSAYRRGDVVTYRIPQGEQKGGRIIHRIVGGSAEKGFTLQGDNTSDADLWHPKPADIEGTPRIVVPWVGHVLAALRSPPILAAIAGGFAFAFALTWSPRRQNTGELPSEQTLAA